MRDNIIRIIIAVLLAVLIEFAFVAVAVNILALCFGFIFSWKLAFGVWIALVVLSAFLKPSRKK